MNKYAPREWAPDETPMSCLDALDARRKELSAGDTVLQLRAGLPAAHLDRYRAPGGSWGLVQGRAP